MNKRKQAIIQYILAEHKTHYVDIAAHLQLSERTIATYLDQIEMDLVGSGVQLVRKPNDGIYLTGDVGHLSSQLETTNQELPQTKTERCYYLLAKLLLGTEAITVQNLAEALYVSRSTVENDLKQVKQYLQQFELTVTVTHAGLQLAGDEQHRRQATTELISQYWGKRTQALEQDGQLIQNSQLPEKLHHLFTPAVIETTLAALGELLEKTQLLLTDYEFQSLAIHLMITFERLLKNQLVAPSQSVTAPIVPETAILVAILERRFNQTLPLFERANINLHLVAVKSRHLDPQLVTTNERQPASLAQWLRQQLVQLKVDDELIHGLVLHLNSALKRLRVGLTIRNAYTEEIRRNFPQAFDQAVLLRPALQTDYQVALNDDELAFISLHFEALFERHTTDQRVSVVVVCSSGIGTSQLLGQRLEKQLAHRLRITRIIALGELMASPISEDLVISTIAIKGLTVPVVEVSPLLNKHDVQMIQQMIDQQPVTGNPLTQLLQPAHIIITDEPLDYQMAIERLGQSLIQTGEVIAEIIPAAIEREVLDSTALGKIAIPHANPQFVKQAAIGLLIAPNGIIWKNQEKVHLVFLMALNERVQPQVRDIYGVLNQLIDNQRLTKSIYQAPDVHTVLKLLNQISK